MAASLRLVFRQIAHNPGFSISVILTLALGIGVNTAVFSMLNGFLLRPLPFHEPDRLAAIAVHKEGISPRAGAFVSGEESSFDADDWRTIRDNTSALLLAATGSTSGANMKASAAAGGVVRYVNAARVSAGYFGVLGAPILLGRELSNDEDRAGGANGVVLSYKLWTSSFGGDRGIVGRSIELKGDPYTVTGVLAPEAMTPQKEDLFIPLRILARGSECDGGDNCGILARLKPGVDWNIAQAQLRRVRLHGFAQLSKVQRGRGWVLARPLSIELAGDMRGRVKLLSMAVGLVLLIACANLAGLMMVRLSRRSREMAVRLALGATPGTLIQQLWIESTVLALLGGASGLLLAVAIATALRNFLPPYMIPIGGFALDGRVLAFALAASLVSSILFGILPAIFAVGGELNVAMGAASRTATRGGTAARQWMAGAQVALTFVLLAAAGMFVRTLVHLATLPPSFDTGGLMTVKASLDSARYRRPEAFRQLLGESLAQLRQIPGVESAAVASSVPFERGLNLGFQIRDGSQAGARPVSSMAFVTPGYFETMKIPLLGGRLPAATDTGTSQPVAVVNRSFARKFYREDRPLGRHFTAAGTTFTVVGIVADTVKNPATVSDAPLGVEPVYYLPAAQTPQRILTAFNFWFQPSWIVRTSRSFDGLANAMAKALDVRYGR